MTTFAITIDVTVRWLPVSPELWNADSCLYAYLAPYGSEILYLGIAWAHTVRQRWNRSAKLDLWEWIERQGFATHELIVGNFSVRPENRLSKQLALDVESLLIRGVQPAGNIQCKQSRISRPGMRVTCEGYWPLRNKRFYDAG
jgi:hypothetical protein